MKRILLSLLALVLLHLEIGLAQSTDFPNILDKGGIQILCKSAVAVSAPADTTEDTLATCTVPAGALGANGLVRVWSAWTTTNSANQKTLRMRYSGGAGTVVATDLVPNQSITRKVVWMANRNATNSQVFSNAGTNDEAGSGGLGIKGGTYAYATTAVDTTASSSIVITCQKATAGETCTLESFLVELMPSN